MYIKFSQSQWPSGLRRRSAAARLLRLWVRIPRGAWMSVCCECCVLSGRGLCDALITRPEEPYRMWCVVVCDLETSRMRRPWSALGRSAKRKKQYLDWSLSVWFLQNTGCLSTLTYSMDQRSYPVLRKSRNSPQCMQPEGSLPRLQEPDTCYMLHPSHSSWFDHPNDIGWGLQII